MASVTARWSIWDSTEVAHDARRHQDNSLQINPGADVSQISTSTGRPWALPSTPLIISYRDNAAWHLSQPPKEPIEKDVHKQQKKEPLICLSYVTRLSPSPHQGAQRASSSSARPEKFQQKQPKRFFPTTKHNFFHNGLQKAIAKTHPSKIQLKLRTEFLYVHF